MATHSPFGSFMVSALIHSSAVVALIAAPELVPLNLGTEPPTQIEFEALPAKGEPDAPLKKSEAEVSLPAPAPAATKASAPTPSKPAVKTEPKLATVLPEKEIVEEAPPSEIDESEGVVAATTEHEVQAEPQEKLLEQIAEQETLEEELTKPLEREVSKFEDAVPDELPSEEIVAAAASTAQRGINQAVRSYESLSQVPGNSPPKYPSQARLNRQQGKVVLKYFVTTDGNVASLQLMQSSGFPLLDQEAVNSIRQFRYRPGQEGWTVHPVNFSLKGPEQKMGGRLRTSMR